MNIEHNISLHLNLAQQINIVHFCIIRLPCKFLYNVQHMDNCWFTYVSPALFNYAEYSLVCA